MYITSLIKYQHVVTEPQFKCGLNRETDDSRKVRFAHVRETSVELRESSPILRESSDNQVNVITLSSVHAPLR